jgi:hypothetical protein
MGFRVLLIAVSGKDPDSVHRDYGVTPTGEYEEIPESPVTGALLPNGAYLLYINDDIVPDDPVLASLSKGASLIACYANETVMNSLTSSWRDGVEEWSVFHDAQEAIGHLEISGDPPDQLKSIQERLLAEQEGTEGTDFVFDIPDELFAALGGMRYDQDIEGAPPEPWQALARAAARPVARKRWWWPFG